MRTGTVVVVCFLAMSHVAGCRTSAPPPATPPTQDVVIDADAKIRIGMTREQVSQTLGAPQSTQTIVKTDEPIWGVIEGWWAELDDGDRVEIMHYPVTKGRLEVYFLNDSDAVWHTAFVPDGVVF